LDKVTHPLFLGLIVAHFSIERALAAAVRSGSVPLRGHRRGGYLGLSDLGLDRIEKRIVPEAQVELWDNTIRSSGSEFTDCEADRRAMMAWLTENALPAGWHNEDDSARQGGRPPQHDWDGIKEICLELLDRNGPVKPGSAWTRAKLEVSILERIARISKEPPRSTLQKKLTKWLAEWEKRRAKT
jgi:hypothetical protein